MNEKGEMFVKSRIPRTTDLEDSNKYNNASESHNEERKCIGIVHGKPKELSQKEMDDLTAIFSRRTPYDPDDVFGRIKINSTTFNRFKGRWPALKLNLAETNTDIFTQYKQLSTNMLHDYANLLIYKNLMLPPTALKTLPVIDFHKHFRTPIDDVADNSIAPDIAFSEDDLITLRSAGKKLFSTRFKEFIVRLNKSLYKHFKIMKSDDGEYQIRYDTYVGTELFWMIDTISTVCIRLKPSADKLMPCDVKIKDYMSYEQILSQYIPSMKWTAEMINFWSNLFGVPSNWKQTVASVLKPNSDKNSDECDIENLHLVFNTKEEKLLKKIYGSDIYTLRGSKNINDKMSNLITLRIIPSVTTILSVIYLLVEQGKADSSETTKDGRIRETFGKTVVIADTPYHSK